MELSFIDVAIFLAFIACVISVGLLKSRKEKTSEDYFLAGRGLSWWLIGFSLIAANISTEQFVGMSGKAADWLGLAIASYEWMAAITLVVVAFVFLPKFLKSGIYTIPEYLEYRYSEASRSIMAFFTMVIYVGVTIAAVIFSGAITVDTLFQGRVLFGFIPINIVTASWIIGILAAVYVVSGGLKACAWADLLQGSALIAGGAIVVGLAISKLGATPVAELTSGLNSGIIPGGLTDNAGGLTKFFQLNKDKLHMVLPRTDAEIPWTALVLGLWIPNFYYWGLNQYITQRTLGSKSLAQGQKGIVFAAFLKLLIPFIIVIPGIVAFNLFSGDMAQKANEGFATVQGNEKTLLKYEKLKDAPPTEPFTIFECRGDFKKLYPEKTAEVEQYNERVAAAAEQAKVEPVKEPLIGYLHDSAFALLIGKLIPSGVGLQGFMLAAILGAVMSSLAAMLNSASTIFTMDLYKKYMNKDASQRNLVTIGRFCVIVFVVIGCLISPLLGDPKFGGIFTYIQEFQGFISPGILAVFVFGLIVKKAPPITGIVGLLLNPPMYGIVKMILPKMAFLDRMALSFFCVLAVMGIITLIKPLKVAKSMPVQTQINLESSGSAKVLGVIVVAITIALYIYFW